MQKNAFTPPAPAWRCFALQSPCAPALHQGARPGVTFGSGAAACGASCHAGLEDACGSFCTSVAFMCVFLCFVSRVKKCVRMNATKKKREALVMKRLVRLRPASCLRSCDIVRRNRTRVIKKPHQGAAPPASVRLHLNEPCANIHPNLHLLRIYL